jgi:hypothetical protein
MKGVEGCCSCSFACYWLAHACLSTLNLANPMKPQLWHRALNAAAAARLPPLHLATEAQPLVRDTLVGCASVGLAALPALGALDGYYHITDGARLRRGQIKVEVRGRPVMSGWV